MPYFEHVLPCNVHDDIAGDLYILWNSIWEYRIAYYSNVLNAGKGIRASYRRGSGSLVEYAPPGRIIVVH